MVSHISAPTAAPSIALAAQPLAYLTTHSFPLVDVHFDGAAPTTITDLIEAGNAKRSALAAHSNPSVQPTSDDNPDPDPTAALDAEYALALLDARRKMHRTLQHRRAALHTLRLKTALLRKRALHASRRKTTAPVAAPAPSARKVWQPAPSAFCTALDPPVIDRSLCASPLSSDTCEDPISRDIIDHYEPRPECRVEEELSFKQCAIYSA